MDEARHAAAWGVEFGEPKIDLDKLREFKNSVVKRLTSGTGQLAKHRKVNYIQGLAEIVDPHTLRVKRTDGGEETLTFEHAIIATGSRPAMPAIADRWTIRASWIRPARSTSPTFPKSLLVVGGGYIGLELGSVYAALGSAVTVVEMTPRAAARRRSRSRRHPGAAGQQADEGGDAEHQRRQDEGRGQRHPRHASRAKGAQDAGAAVRSRAGVRSAAGRTRRSRASTRPASRSTSAASSSSTSSCAPTSRRFSRSATSPASRCWRTRRRTKGASPSR